ncbi:hypothetical protein ACFCZ3_14715 [Cellulosimicrobium cellulans]|uniref:hypothetical protein n=1 Tax=Cellulosimicrobium cellulans TaxID=1710 RepID=UPI0035E11733
MKSIVKIGPPSATLGGVYAAVQDHWAVAAVLCLFAVVSFFADELRVYLALRLRGAALRQEGVPDGARQRALLHFLRKTDEQMPSKTSSLPQPEAGEAT